MAETAGDGIGEARVEQLKVVRWEGHESEFTHYASSRLTRFAAERAPVGRIIGKRLRNYEAIAGQAPVDRLLVPSLPKGACPLFVPVIALDKSAMVRFFHQRGVEAVPVWLEAHAAIPAGAFPEVEYLRAQIVELPCHQDIDEHDAGLIGEYLREAIQAGL